MMFLIRVHWTRRVRDPEQDDEGTTTYAEFAPTATAATTKAVKKFNRHYGLHRAITSTTQETEPAPTP